MSKKKTGQNPKPDEIRAARETHGLSQTAAAELCFSNLRSWQNWESGHSRMHPAIWMYWLHQARELKI